MSLKRFALPLFAALYCSTTPLYCGEAPLISHEEAQSIGKQIWRNECGCKVSGLTAWNEGEPFASMGIGHFIWFPKGLEAPYEEQFPQLLAFFEERGVALPEWLKDSKACPWSNRKAFLEETQKEKLTQLRELLASTIDLQIIFMSKRLESALPKMLSAVPESKRQPLTARFYRVARSEKGLYPLLDYLNFKGEGSSPLERYRGEGWGLLQVLELMEEGPDEGILKNFATTAKNVLLRRIGNAPPERREERWLKGWFNRLDTYPRSD